MKRLILACGLVGAIATANAQPPEHPPIDPQQRAVHLQKTLQLTDEQTAKVKKIFESSAPQQQALMDKYKPQLEAFRADEKALREQVDGQITGVLTPKQQEAFKQLLKDRGKRFKHMHGKGDHGPYDQQPPQ
ncbi:MAG TPA: hypothetical protein VLC91_07805 [Spongiibacteraceae bacterium]|nr:hypothetical protein [Spongiibacteraceae bacterium]